MIQCNVQHKNYKIEVVPSPSCMKLVKKVPKLPDYVLFFLEKKMKGYLTVFLYVCPCHMYGLLECSYFDGEKRWRQYRVRTGKMELARKLRTREALLTS